MNFDAGFYARARDTGHRTLEVFVLDRAASVVFSDYTAGLSLDQADDVLARYGFRRSSGWEEDLPGRSWAIAVPV